MYTGYTFYIPDLNAKLSIKIKNIYSTVYSPYIANELWFFFKNIYIFYKHDFDHDSAKKCDQNQNQEKNPIKIKIKVNQIRA